MAGASPAIGSYGSSPDSAPPDRLETLSGKTLSLSSFQGKWLLINVWAPWCPRCKMEFPLLNELDAMSDLAVVGLAADYGIDPASVSAALARYPTRFPQVLAGSLRDPDSIVRRLTDARYVPMSYLYTPEGDLAMTIPGAVSKRAILDRISAHPKPAAAAPAKKSSKRK